jgi:hypothetical protein
MSKKHRGKQCVYCGAAESTSADHVFARSLFLQRHRGDLPQVPACKSCNQDKSRLEHYLATLLPFGGRHETARERLETDIRQRLARNMALHSRLRQGERRVFSKEGELIVPVMAMPVDTVSLLRWCDYVAKGLAAYHWKCVLGTHCTVRSMSLTAAGEREFDRLMTNCSSRALRKDLGAGTVVYEGVTLASKPNASLWRLRLYGGLRFMESGDGDDVSECFGMMIFPLERGAKHGAFTAPRDPD